MNKKIGLSLALACIFLADTAKAEKVGFINEPELIQKSTALQGLQMQREKLLAVLKIDFDAEAARIMEQKSDLQEEMQKKNDLSQAEVGKQLDEIRQAEKDLNVRAQQASVELQKNYMDAILSVKKEAIDPVVRELAKENGYDAILNSASAYFVKEDLDLTKEAIKRINKKMPKIDLKKVSFVKDANQETDTDQAKEKKKNTKNSNNAKKSQKKKSK